MTRELLRHELGVLKDSLSYLPKWKVDSVAQFADRLGIYALHYNPLEDAWHLSDGEFYTTDCILKEVEKSGSN